MQWTSPTAAELEEARRRTEALLSTCESAENETTCDSSQKTICPVVRGMQALIAELRSHQVELERRLEKIAALSPDAIVLLDAHSRIRYASPALARMLDLPLAKLEEAELAAWIDTRDRAAFDAHLRESRDSSGARTMTLRLTRPNEGTNLWFELNSQPMPRGDVGGETQVVLILRDVTERFMADRERNRMQDALVEVIERRQHSAGTELHEDIAQSTAGLAMLAYGLVSELAQSSNPQADKAKFLGDVLNRLTNQVRSVAILLSPLIDLGGLTTSLRRLAIDAHEQWGLDVQLDLDETIELEDETAQLFWIAHEAVTNVGRHAHASRLWICWQRNEAGIRLEIADDGSGIARPLQQPHGIGIDVMRARAYRIGCVLSIDSKPDQGTTVAVTCPATYARRK